VGVSHVLSKDFEFCVLNIRMDMAMAAKKIVIILGSSLKMCLYIPILATEIKEVFEMEIFNI
jgi:hypothetical protein